MAYLNSLVAGAKLAFVVGLMLAITNGVSQRVSPSKRTLDAIVNEQISKVGL